VAETETVAVDTPKLDESPFMDGYPAPGRKLRILEAPHSKITKPSFIISKEASNIIFKIANSAPEVGLLFSHF
jgi:hypothetical protein